MRRHYFINGVTAAQYLTYLLAGALYFAAFGVMMGEIGSAFRFAGLFVPLILGGYVPGLSLVTPRVAAILAFICALPYLIIGLTGLRVAAHGSAFFAMPSALVITISVVAFLWSESSAWRRAKRKSAKALIVTLAIVPAAYATVWLGAFVFRLLTALRRAR